MSIQIIFIPSERDFSSAEKALIRTTITTHAKKALAVLKAPQQMLTFTISPAWERTDREGMPAFTQSRDWVRIAVNLKQFRSPKYRKQMMERLAYLIYHETHHAVRRYAGFLPGKQQHILMNSIISEGLADHFALEQLPSEYVKDKMTFNLREVRKWLPKIKKIKWEADYHDSWVMGGKGKPAALGYKIGRYLIENIKRRYPRFTATKEVRIDVKKALKKSGIKI